jgi:transmembrane sensor
MIKIKQLKQQNEIKRLFKLYLEGETNARQEELLFRHLNEGGDKDPILFEEMKNSWENEPSSPDNSPEAEESLDQIWLKVEKKSHKRLQRVQMMKYAASVLLLLSTGLGWYAYQKKESIKTVQLISKITRAGEKLKLILPDSSVVYLAGNSKLNWPSHFTKGNTRNIHLEGEAFFEVKHDTTSPFIVQTANLRTQVVGTSFNVYAYPDDKLATVTVKTGKVAVAENVKGKVKRLSFLTPGMKLIYQQNNGKYAVSSSTNVNEANSWTLNRFVFRDESLKGVLAGLERYYNVNFIQKGKHFDHYKFSVTFSNKNIKDVMEQLHIMSGNKLRYKITNNNTVITLWEEAAK